MRATHTKAALAVLAVCLAAPASAQVAVVDWPQSTEQAKTNDLLAQILTTNQKQYVLAAEQTQPAAEGEQVLPMPGRPVITQTMPVPSPIVKGSTEEAWINGWMAGSWMTFAFVFGTWMFTRLPFVLEALLAVVLRKPRPTP